MVRTLQYLLCGIVALAAAGTSAAPARAPFARRNTTEPGATTYEAEDAILSGTEVDTAQEGFTGEIGIAAKF